LEIESVEIQGFKSLRDVRVTFGKINIMIGGNGVGKSNLISYFKLLNQIINKNLRNYTSKDGADNLLYFGRKLTQKLTCSIVFKNGKYRNAYKFDLEPSNEDGFFFTNEYIFYKVGNSDWTVRNVSIVNNRETSLFDYHKNDLNIYGSDKSTISSHVIKAFKQFKVYHFHDTSESAKVKQKGSIDDNKFLREDASNLAAFLYMLQEKNIGSYRQIEGLTKQVAPFFNGFNLNPSALNPDEIRLEWLEVGSDKYFNAHSLSDGTIRMICLATLFLQPNPPSTIIVDEPELGLHPFAINLLASLIQAASEKSQVIISTQSVTLINQFTPEDIIVVDRVDNQSVFRRLDQEELDSWQEEYALGEIWEKNLIGGRP